ncbi:MAG: iron-sulfur cluster assembly accessory protein [Alphaproteobacteria bacterium]|nr:iron-sulfur cluster assembly accessory protein [Alphaproteobacteria bacterium]
MTSITLTNFALARIHEIQQKESNHEKFLRISISGGGCSGFQYVFSLDDRQFADDVKICEENEKIIAVTDQTSLPFLNGAEVDFVKELGASYFKVNNPNAKASCGCGSSFSV